MSGIAEIDVAGRTRGLLEPVLSRDGYELIDVEWTRNGGRWTLRLFIDRESGVGIEDCQLVSRTVEPILDVEDFIEPAYDLEVSSPGLDRPLKKLEHFSRYAGQHATVKTFGPVALTAPGSSGRKHFSGVLRGFEDGNVLIEVEGVLHRIPHDRIAKAHLEYDVQADLHKKDGPCSRP